MTDYPMEIFKNKLASVFLSIGRKIFFLNKRVGNNSVFILNLGVISLRYVITLSWHHIAQRIERIGQKSDVKSASDNN